MLTQENFGSVIDEMMRGAIDMHVHFGPDMPPAPDIRVARRLDGLGIARQAREAGMRAIVMKSHHWPTGALARTIQPIIPEVALFGILARLFLDQVPVGANLVFALMPGRANTRFAPTEISICRKIVRR